MRRVGFPEENPSHKQALLVGRMHCLSGSVAAFLFVGCLASVYGNERDSWAKDWRPCHLYSLQFSCLVMSDFATSWTAAHQAPLSITNSWSLLKLISVESVMPSNHLILCHLLLPPSVFPSVRGFSNESILCIRWPKYCSFGFSISPSNGYSGLISFRMDWLDLLAVQGTLKSFLQHHSSEASVLRHLPFFMVQISHPYMTTGKTIVLTRRTFVSKLMSLLF